MTRREKRKLARTGGVVGATTSIVGAGALVLIANLVWKGK